jgi:cobalt/nickel transport system permease protein
MRTLIERLLLFRALDDSARGHSILHRLHPLAKLLVTLFFLVSLLSFGKREVVRVFPLVLYPAACLSLAELSTAPLAGLLALAAPPILCLGALNPLFDRAPVPFGNAFIPGGWLVFASLSLKGFLSVTAAYILAATTGAGPLFGSLGRLGLPRILCVQFSLVYRYLSLLMEEAARILKAHSLRAGGRRGVEPRLWGPLLGQLLIRTWARAERVYGAMLLRGFDGKYRAGPRRRFGAADLAFVAAAAAFFATARLVDLPALAGGLLLGVTR